MPRHVINTLASLLLGLFAWTAPASATLAPVGSLNCTDQLGPYPGVAPCVDLSVSGLSMQGSGLLPLGAGGGSNSNAIDPSYGDVLTRVTVTQIGTGNGLVVPGIDAVEGAMGLSFNLVLEDIDPLYDFANGQTSVSRDFDLALFFQATFAVGTAGDSLPLSSVHLEFLSGVPPVKLPLFDVNGNGETDALFIDAINLDSLDGVFVDILLPLDAYPSVVFTFGAATGTFDGRVEDVLTDPPFSLALTATTIGTAAAPAGLWLLALGGLAAGAAARRLRRC